MHTIPQSGFAGVECRELDCPGQPDCSGRGTCVLSPTTSKPICVCNPRYNGTECEKLDSGASALVDLSAPSALVSSATAGTIINANVTSDQSGATVVGKVVKTALAVRDTYTLAFLVSSPRSLVRVCLSGW
jgi:hypothetical protein